MYRRDMLRRKPLPFCGIKYPVSHEPGQALFIEVLKLAATTAREVAAGRRGVMWPRLNSAIGEDNVAGRGERHMLARGRDSITFGGDANDRIAHRQAAYAAGICLTMSLARNAGPARRPASECSQTASQAA